MRWTEEKEAVLKKMWNEGAKVPLIIAELGGGLTPDQIYHKKRKLDLPDRVGGGGQRHSATVHNPNPKSQPLPPSREPDLQGTATILTLGAHMCKWPIGDPGTASFSICGRKQCGKDKYCIEHEKVAREPRQPRRHSADELTRSLRYYL